MKLQEGASAKSYRIRVYCRSCTESPLLIAWDNIYLEVKNGTVDPLCSYDTESGIQLLTTRCRLPHTIHVAYETNSDIQSVDVLTDSVTGFGTTDSAEAGETAQITLTLNLICP